MPAPSPASSVRFCAGKGLYRSHLDKWRQQRREGTLQALSPQRRGPKVDPQAAEIARLRRENGCLQERLRRAENIIAVQKSRRATWRTAGREPERRVARIEMTEELAQTEGTTAACQALGVPRSTLYRVRKAQRQPLDA